MIELGTGFDVLSTVPVDSRMTLTKEQMRNMLDSLMPDTYMATCTDDGKLYIYNKKNDIDIKLGKFREISENEDMIYFDSKNDWETAKMAGELDENTYYSYPENDDVEMELSAENVTYNDTNTSLGKNTQAAIDKLYFDNTFKQDKGAWGINYFSEFVEPGELVVSYNSGTTSSYSTTNSFLERVSVMLKTTIPAYLTNHGSHIVKLYKKVKTLEAKVALLEAGGGGVIGGIAKQLRAKFFHSESNYGPIPNSKIYVNDDLVQTLSENISNPQENEYSVRGGSKVKIAFPFTTNLYGEHSSSAGIESHATINGLSNTKVPADECYFTVPNTEETLQMNMYFSSWLDRVEFSFGGVGEYDSIDITATKL